MGSEGFRLYNVTHLGTPQARAALPALSSLLAAALVAAGCRDFVSPGRGVPTSRGFSQSPTGVHLTGLGGMGAGTATPGSDRQSFNFDVSDAPGGRLTYSDYRLVTSGGVATVTVDPTADAATAITSFTQTSTACATFAGTGRGEDGLLKEFAVAACDNGSPGAGVDSFRIWVPSAAYGKSAKLTDGEITLSGGSPPAINRIAGVGTTGLGTPTVGSDLQEFNFDVASTLSGRLFYRDWSAVRRNGTTVAVVTVDTDPATGITAYRNSSTACADSTHGVEFHGIGRVDTGEYFDFIVVACDNGPAGSGADFFRFSIPLAANYSREGLLSSGDIAKNRPPTAAFTWTCSGLTCAFTDGSTDPDGSVVAWQWTWGDGGTSTAQNQSHSYAAAGSYTVTLSVTDNQGATGSTSQTVTATAPNQPPTASFTVRCSGLTCGFTSTSSGPDGTITAYSWTFGDGTSTTAQNPSYSYAAGGSYTVTLTVTDNQGATGSTSQTVTVTQPNQPPSVSAGSDQTVLLGLLYTLSASFSDPDNDGPWSYTIDWGDGSSSSSSLSSQGTFTAQHNYLLIGSYTIRVTLTDSHGASGAGTKVLTVLVNLGL